MSDPTPTNGVRTWIARLAEVSEVVGKISGGSLSTLLLGVVLAAYFGWIQSPFGALPEALAVHDQRVVRVVEARAQTDRSLALVLEALQRELSRMNRVQQVRTCAEIANLSLREMCLR